MKKIVLLCVICLWGISNTLFAQTCDGTDITIVNGVNGGTETHHAQNTLVTQAPGPIAITGNANVTYKAGTGITLNNGFSVALGSQFKAEIEACTIAQDSTSFITVWETLTDNETIIIPTYTGESYSYTVDWGDGSTDPNVYTANASHSYDDAGLHEIKISGDFPRIDFKGLLGARIPATRIRTIKQWGNMEWTSMEGAFYVCIFLNIDPAIPDTPDLSLVTDMREMFYLGSSLDYDFGSWDISNVTQMDGMLSNTNLSDLNYEKTLNGWSQQTGIQSNVTLGANGLMYCDATGRDVLTDTNVGGLSWTINGDSQATNCNRSSTSNSSSNSTATIEPLKNLSIHPNPVNERIYITGLPENRNNLSIQVVDVAGRTVLHVKNQDQIDVSSLKAGVYFVQIVGERQFTTKFVKM